MCSQTLDIHSSESVIDIFNRAAQANINTEYRQGSAVLLPAKGNLLMTGDLHDNTINYQKIVKLAQLDQSKENHVVLHELIHGPHLINGRDLSIRLMAQAAALKVQYPNQVHYLLSNHELAQVTGKNILKDGKSILGSFEAGLYFLYGNDSIAVTDAIKNFVFSLPLAVQGANGIFCAHSLPSPAQLKAFDPDILDRAITNEDLQHNGSAHSMVWGRKHTQELADQLARAWGANIFILGHQPAEMGFETEGENILILASDHNHGAALSVDLATAAPDLQTLIDHLIYLTAAGL